VVPTTVFDWLIPVASKEALEGAGGTKAFSRYPGGGISWFAVPKASNYGPE